MDIILLQKVANLGQIGDRVKVKSGYARNFLVPTGRATVATAANIAQFEAQRAVLEAKANEELKQAQARALNFENFKLEIKAKAGTEGKLFGSIGTSDIAEAAVERGPPDRALRSAHADRPDPLHGRTPGPTAPAYGRQCDAERHDRRRRVAAAEAALRRRKTWRYASAIVQRATPATGCACRRIRSRRSNRCSAG